MFGTTHQRMYYFIPEDVNPQSTVIP